MDEHALFNDALHLLPTRAGVEEYNQHRHAATNKSVVCCLARHNCEYDGQNAQILFCAHALHKCPTCTIEYGLPWVSMGAYEVVMSVATTLRVM
jgi:hypothetical protein